MTYCLGIKVKGGLVAIADNRITAGTEVYSNKKVSTHQIRESFVVYYDGRFAVN